jgi:quercetin dioxygenase-like cupin family protein
MSDNEQPFVYLPDLLTTLGDLPPDSILSRTVHQDARCRVILFGFTPGQELSEHTASKPAILHILRGEGTLTLGGERRAFEAGAWAYMQPNLPHSIHADSPVVMLLTMLEIG